MRTKTTEARGDDNKLKELQSALVRNLGEWSRARASDKTTHAERLALLLRARQELDEAARKAGII